MFERPIDRQTALISRTVADLFLIDATYEQHGRVVFALRPRFERARSLKMLDERLRTAGYQFELNRRDDMVTLSIDPTKRLIIPRLNLLLFVATLLSMYLVPVYIRSGLDFALTWANLKSGMGLEFTVALMSILFCHEMGHFVASRRRGIVTSWPYFLPAPNLIGSFGAIIKSKSPIWNRRDLIEVGASGPIVGWIVTVGWLLIGLSQSHLVFSPPDPDFGRLLIWTHGESVLMRTLMAWLVGIAGPGQAYELTEAAFAGWVGLIITAINMLPIGQLDGGHVLYGLFRRVQHRLGIMAVVALIFLGFQSPMWWLFALIGVVFGPTHPPTLDDKRPLSNASVAFGVAALVILVLSFTPIPFAW